MLRWMISVHETEKLSWQEIEKFLLAAKEVRFEANQREEVYGWIERRQQRYVRARIALGKAMPASDFLPHLPRGHVAAHQARQLCPGR